MDHHGPRTLTLWLTRDPFEATISGAKGTERRRDSRWIRSRLFDSTTGLGREYDEILYIHGYSKNSPRFRCKWGGVSWDANTSVWVIINDFSQ
jgi:hypothetical protein